MSVHGTPYAALRSHGHEDVVTDARELLGGDDWPVREPKYVNPTALAAGTVYFISKNNDEVPLTQAAVSEQFGISIICVRDAFRHIGKRYERLHGV